MQSRALPLGYGASEAPGRRAPRGDRDEYRGLPLASILVMVRGLMQWVLLFLGGGLGAVARYALSVGVQGRLETFHGTFPWGVLAVNGLGCFAIGLVVIAGDEHRWLGPGAREFLVAGLLGGFTTFSAFGFDTWRLLAAGENLAAFANVAASVGGGLAAVALGVAAARALG